MTRDVPALLDDAAARGFSLNFEAKADALLCRETGTAYGLGDITVVDVLQKDAGTDPGDEATLFLLEASDGTRGVLLIGNPASLSAPERAVLDRMQSR